MRRLARSATIGLAASALALSSMASAQVKCPVISSVLADEPEKLHGIGIVINRKGYVDVAKDGLPGAIRNADDCDIRAPSDGFMLDCNWQFALGESTGAKREFDRLRKRLNDCLPTALEEQQIRQTTPEQLERYAQEYGTSFVEHISGTEDLGRYKQVIDLESGAEFEVSISYKRDNRTGQHWINVDFYLN